MKVQRFEDLIAWQKAQDLAVSIYDIFKNHKDYGFKDQICRAAISISNNIAEGFERNSSLEFRRFISISQGSSSEVKSMIYLAFRLNYLNQDQKNSLLESSIEVSKILNGLFKSINAKTMK